MFFFFNFEALAFRRQAIKTRGESVAVVLGLIGARPVTEGTGRVARYVPSAQFDFFSRSLGEKMEKMWKTMIFQVENSKVGCVEVDVFDVILPG